MVRKQRGHKDVREIHKTPYCSLVVSGDAMMGSRRNIVIVFAFIVSFIILSATGLFFVERMQYHVSYLTEDFLVELQHKNITVETPLSELTGYTGYGSPSIIADRPRRILANGSEITIYEFLMFEDAEEAARTISPDGQRVGFSFIHWISKPHFYKKGKLIVQYVGEDQEMLKSLEDILGKPFVSGK